MKLPGTDKYHGNYVELRSDSKWENVKVHLLKCVSILTKRVIKTLFVITVTISVRGTKQQGNISLLDVPSTA